MNLDSNRKDAETPPSAIQVAYFDDLEPAMIWLRAWRLLRISRAAHASAA